MVAAFQHLLDPRKQGIKLVTKLIRGNCVHGAGLCHSHLVHFVSVEPTWQSWCVAKMVFSRARLSKSFMHSSSSHSCCEKLAGSADRGSGNRDCARVIWQSLLASVAYTLFWLCKQADVRLLAGPEDLGPGYQDPARGGVG